MNGNQTPDTNSPFGTPEITLDTCVSAVLEGHPPEKIPEALLPHILEVFVKHKKTIKAFDDYAHKHLFAGHTIQGWFLKPGSRVAKFTNIQGAFSKLKQDFAVKPEEFCSACTLNKGGVESLVKEKMGPATPQYEVDHYVGQLVTQFGEVKESKPSLRKEPAPKAA